MEELYRSPSQVPVNFYLIHFSLFMIHTTPEKFEQGVFTLKTTHQMFPVHTTPEKFVNATTTGHFGFVFSKIFVFKKFSVHSKTQSRRFQIPPV